MQLIKWSDSPYQTSTYSELVADAEKLATLDGVVLMRAWTFAGIAVVGIYWLSIVVAEIPRETNDVSAEMRGGRVIPTTLWSLATDGRSGHTL